MATRKIPTYSMVTITKAPFVMQSSVEGRYSGLLIDLLNELARRLRFEYKITMSDRNTAQGQANRDNHANQCNPNHGQWKGGSNHANQLNPNNSQYGGGRKK
ncbi:hypothetical protein TKK_0005741 [Trichogramma kaykai]